MTPYFMWAILHLGAWALMLLAAAGLGALALRKYRFDSLLERAIFTSVTGLGGWGVILFLLGLAGLLHKTFIIALTIAAAALSAVYLLRSYKAAHLKLSAWREYRSPRGLFIASVFIAAVAYWALLLLLTQYPPINWDSVAYHLVLAKEYLRQHRIIVHDGIAFPVLPALNHMLFTWGLALKDDIMAQMVTHTLMMLTGLGAYAWGKRQKQPGMGVAAAAFWLGSPLVLWLGESAYVDVGMTCFAFLGLYALRIFWTEREARWWYLALALLTMAAAVKLPGLSFAGLASALGLWVILRPRIKRGRLGRLLRSGDPEQAKSDFTWKSLVWGWGLVLVLMAPFYGFIGYATGNPFWPAFPELSDPMWFAPAERFWSGWTAVGVEKTPLNFLSLPYRIALDPSPFLPDNHRMLVPMIIAWPLAWVVSFFNRSVRWWTLWALAFTTLWFMSSQQIRFWVTAMPMVALGLYESVNWLLSKIPRPALLKTAVWSALTLSAIWMGMPDIVQVLNTKGWLPPITQSQRELWLTGLSSGYRAARYINKRAQENEAIYVINFSWLNYYLESYVIDRNALLQQRLRPTYQWPQDEEWAQWLKSRNANWILVNYADLKPYRGLPNEPPYSRSFWPDYKLVYTDSAAWVFRRTDAPAP